MTDIGTIVVWIPFALSVIALLWVIRRDARQPDDRAERRRDRFR
jgi:hypothetical protein